MLVKFVIDRFESDKAVLLDNEGRAIVWPKEFLPENLGEGSAVNFAIVEENEREKNGKQTAKDILNEIINHP